MALLWFCHGIAMAAMVLSVALPWSPHDNESSGQRHGTAACRGSAMAHHKDTLQWAAPAALPCVDMLGHSQTTMRCYGTAVDRHAHLWAFFALLWILMALSGRRFEVHGVWSRYMMNGH